MEALGALKNLAIPLVHVDIRAHGALIGKTYCLEWDPMQDRPENLFLVSSLVRVGWDMVQVRALVLPAFCGCEHTP